MRLAAISLVLVFWGSSLPAQSGPTDGSNDGELWNAACAQVGEVAESIMRLRLDNTPMPTLMKRTDETVGQKADKASEDYAAFLKRLIVEAYRRPAYTVKEYRDRAVAEFRNEAELACYTGGI